MDTEQKIFEALCFDGGIVNSSAILAYFSKLNKSVLPCSKLNTKTSVTSIHYILWRMDDEMIELRKFSGYCTSETIRGTRKNSSLTSKSIEIFGVSISKRFQSMPAVVSAERNYDNRNYSDRPKHEVIRQALEGAKDTLAPTPAVLPKESTVANESIYEGKKCWGVQHSV